MPPSATSASSMRVLFIDSDSEQAKAVLTPLQGANLNCRYITIQQFSPQVLTKIEPHLVLLHLGLPEIGSADLCVPIRAVSKIPIVILSQRTRREDLFHFLNLGADDLIPIRTLDTPLVLVRILTLLRRVYEYDRPSTRALHPQPVSAQIPKDWLTCDMCSYMGPNHRFDSTNTLGDRALRCPNCNHSSSNGLTFHL